MSAFIPCGPISLFRPVLVLLFIAGLLFQTHIWFSSDVEWLMHLSEEVLAGKQFGTDIFETNPPVILVLYLPALFLKHVLGLVSQQAILLYLSLLACFSLWFCASSWKQVFGKTEPVLGKSLAVMLVFCLFLLPISAFGQREHVWLILILPWLASAVAAAEQKPLPPGKALIAGLLAGMGFMLKPFFLCPLILVESWLLWKNRQWLRIEPLVIAGVIVLCLTGIALWQPGYYQTILPLVMQYYFSGVKYPLWCLIDHISLFPVAVMAWLVFFRKEDRHPQTGRVLLLALIGMLAAHVIALVPWYYHLYPALALGCCSLVWLAVQMWQQSRNPGVPLLAVLLLAGTLTFIPASLHTDQNWLKPVKGMHQYLASHIDRKTEKTGLIVLSLHGTAAIAALAGTLPVSWGSGIPFLWWHGGILHAQENHTLPASVVRHDMDAFTAISVREISRENPEWLVVDIGNPWQPQNQRLGRKSLSLLAFLCLNPDFKKVFAQYAWQKTFGSYLVYKRKTARQ